MHILSITAVSLLVVMTTGWTHASPTDYPYGGAVDAQQRILTEWEGANPAYIAPLMKRSPVEPGFEENAFPEASFQEMQKAFAEHKDKLKKIWEDAKAKSASMPQEASQ